MFSYLRQASEAVAGCLLAHWAMCESEPSRGRSGNSSDGFGIRMPEQLPRVEDMAKTTVRTYDQALAWLREHQFDILEAPGTSNRVFLKKNNCSAAIEKDGESGVKLFAYPGYLIGGEISKLINRGYQQFLKTTKTEVPATADQLKALHAFSEELKEALGLTSLYNESLGTVSENYHYDRVEGRDAKERKKRPWEKQKTAKEPKTA